MTVTAATGTTVNIGFKAISVLAALTTNVKYYEVPVNNRPSVTAL